jgi:hypothetical protein
MSQPVDASSIVSLFGESVSTAGIKSLLESLGTLNRPVLSDENGEETFQDWVLVRREGVELGFVDSKYQEGANSALWGKGEIVLNQVYFYSAFDDVQTFKGKLPHGLAFSDSRDTVRRKLSRYETSRHSFITDTWDIEKYRLNVYYSKNNQHIDHIVCYVVNKPLSKDSEVVYPRLHEVIEAFGSDIRSQEFVALWGEEGIANIHKKVLDNESDDVNVYLRNSYGADLYFSEGQHEMLFNSITLYANRRFESVDWAGDLPYNLGFEDSPEILFQKLKRAPAEHSDDLKRDIGNAVWHFSNYSMNVIYSHRTNRIFQIDLYAPGLWQSFDE